MSWLSRILTGHGGHGAHGGSHGSQREPFPASATPPEAAIDPVTGEAVRTVYRCAVRWFSAAD